MTPVDRVTRAMNTNTKPEQCDVDTIVQRGLAAGVELSPYMLAILGVDPCAAPKAVKAANPNRLKTTPKSSACAS